LVSFDYLNTINQAYGGIFMGEARRTKETTSDSQTSTVYPALLVDKSIYNSLFRYLNDAVAICKVLYDPIGNPIDYQILDVNNAFCRLIRLSEKDVMGNTASQLLPSLTPKHAHWMQRCGQVVLTEKSQTVEDYNLGLGKWLTVYAFCPQKGYFALTIKDLTERKRIENALRQSEKQYKALANSITDPVFALDASLKIKYWNTACEKSLDTKASEVLGKHFFEVFGRSKLTRKHVRVFLNVTRNRNPRTIVDKLSLGGNRIFEIQIYPTGNGTFVFARDVTERSKLQNSLEAYTKNLEAQIKIRTEKLKHAERLIAIGETAGMVGHDIRNPLQSIVGELYLAKDELANLADGSTKDSLLSSLNLVEEQTLYINKIVSDLQDYAKQSIPSIEEVNLEATIQDVIATIDVPQNITVTYIVRQPFPLLKTDLTYIKRVLTNLSLNALQAMQQHGGELKINTFFRDKCVIIAISDTGVGVPDEVKANLFKPLFTTKSKGQGFGLAVVKKLVEALGGSVSFESKLGKGTTFIIELPQ
jgi:PAS domain S-box-containing protein